MLKKPVRTHATGTLSQTHIVSNVLKAEGPKTRQELALALLDRLAPEILARHDPARRGKDEVWKAKPIFAQVRSGANSLVSDAIHHLLGVKRITVTETDRGKVYA